jgi:hypothetical protein
MSIKNLAKVLTLTKITFLSKKRNTLLKIVGQKLLSFLIYNSGLVAKVLIQLLGVIKLHKFIHCKKDYRFSRP